MRRRVPSLIGRLWRYRFHPVTQYGYDMLVDGRRRYGTTRMNAGLALIAAGFVLKRSNPAPRRVYRADLGPGESIGIRVIQKGEVVEETFVPEPSG
jgi:hypothetical protein